MSEESDGKPAAVLATIDNNNLENPNSDDTLIVEKELYKPSALTNLMPLLKAGVDINCLDDNGRAALHYAARCGDAKLS